MEDTAQAPESQAILPQKSTKPTSIKILQFVNLSLLIFSLPALLFGIASFFDPSFACGEDKICANVIFYNLMVVPFTVLSGLGFYSLLKYTAKLKVIGIISSMIILFMFLFFIIARSGVL